MSTLPTYKLHPAIGIARVGDAPNDIYLAPEVAGSLPIECDNQGNPSNAPVDPTSFQFKDTQGRVKRQAARFKVFVYDDESPQGRELCLDDTVYANEASGKLTNIEWTVWVANKKSVWYQFQQTIGETGYAANHPLRNADITDSNQRQALIIDPGPHSVDGKDNRHANFSRDGNPDYAPTFPPPLEPFSINTLGEAMTNDAGHLIVLGGHGSSGTVNTGLGQPRIDYYAQTDGWFDDISDGPITARLIFDDTVNGIKNNIVMVQEPAWVIVGYPAYAPQIEDMISIDEVCYDVAIRQFAYDPYLYGVPDFDSSSAIDASNPQQLDLWRHNDKRRYNPDYYPLFYRDIWPILTRPSNMQWVTSLLGVSFDAHGTTQPKENFYKTAMETPPREGEDPYRGKRQYVYQQLRQPNEVNDFKKLSGNPDSPNYGQPLMPLLCGDNPLSNSGTSKFLSLTKTQLFLLSQWARGRFVNETMAGFDDSELQQGPGVALDKGVLSNLLGGAFCPGGEIAWIIRNPGIYSKPYRIKPDPDFIPNATARGRVLGQNLYNFPNPLSQGSNLAKGQQPGDLTKYSALPWQADFNECSNQPVDITDRDWAVLYPDSIGDTSMAAQQQINLTLWWPSHRPMQVFVDGNQRDWARGIPQTHAGDLKMVSAWKDLGFLIATGETYPKYAETERNPMEEPPEDSPE